MPPAEIEAVLLQHPGVRDVGVVGSPNTDAGELPSAFVVPQPGANLSESELQKFVADRVCCCFQNDYGLQGKSYLHWRSSSGRNRPMDFFLKKRLL